MLNRPEAIPEGVRFDEGLLVADHVGTSDRGQNSNFVECVFLLFFGEIVHFDFFEGVGLRVDCALHFVNAGVCSLAYFANMVPSFPIMTKSLIDMPTRAVLINISRMQVP